MRARLVLTLLFGLLVVAALLLLWTETSIVASIGTYSQLYCQHTSLWCGGLNSAASTTNFAPASAENASVFTQTRNDTSVSRLQIGSLRAKPSRAGRTAKGRRGGVLRPPVFCTLGTGQSHADIILLLHSLRLFHPDSHVHILATPQLQDRLNASYLHAHVDHARFVHMRPSLDPEFEHKGRRGMERQRSNSTSMWTDLMLSKTAVITHALERTAPGQGVWFLDADIVFLHAIPFQDVPAAHVDVGLSRHHIGGSAEAKYGRYNAGYLYVRNVTFLSWWVKETQTGKHYFEQGTLDVAEAAGFVVQQLPIQHNFGHWRFWVQGGPASTQFDVLDGQVTFAGAPLISIHAHLNRNKKFFAFLMELMARAHEHALLPLLKQLGAGKLSSYSGGQHVKTKSAPQQHSETGRKSHPSRVATRHSNTRTRPTGTNKPRGRSWSHHRTASRVQGPQTHAPPE